MFFVDNGNANILTHPIASSARQLDSVGAKIQRAEEKLKSKNLDCAELIGILDDLIETKVDEDAASNGNIEYIQLQTKNFEQLMIN